MSEITEISSNMTQMSQSQVQDKVDVSVLKMALQAEKDMTTMLLKNIDQTQGAPNSTEGHIDLYV